MPGYAILTNRKRAIIALVHSIFFLLIALVQAASAPILSIRIRIHSAFGSAIALLVIYCIVTIVLLILVLYSRC